MQARPCLRATSVKMTAMPHLLTPSAAGGVQQQGVQAPLLPLLCQGQGQMLHQVKACWSYPTLQCIATLKSFESHIMCFFVSHAAVPVSICLGFPTGSVVSQAEYNPCADPALAELYLVSLQNSLLFCNTQCQAMVSLALHGARRRHGSSNCH